MIPCRTIGLTAPPGTKSCTDRIVIFIRDSQRRLSATAKKHQTERARIQSGAEFHGHTGGNPHKAPPTKQLRISMKRGRVLTLADSVQSLSFYFVFVGQSHGGVETLLFLSLSFVSLSLSFLPAVKSSCPLSSPGGSQALVTAPCAQKGLEPHAAPTTQHTHTLIITH